MDYSLLLVVQKVVEYNPNYIAENLDKFKELGPEQKDQDLKKIQKNKLSKNVSDDQIDNFLEREKKLKDELKAKQEQIT